MSLQEVYDLPASEIVVWKEYFNRVPFSEERADERTAMTIASLVNVLFVTSGGKPAKPITPDLFMPDYWDDRNLANQSEKQQIEAEKAFVEKALRTGLATLETKP